MIGRNASFWRGGQTRCPFVSIMLILDIRAANVKPISRQDVAVRSTAAEDMLSPVLHRTQRRPVDAASPALPRPAVRVTSDKLGDRHAVGVRPPRARTADNFCTVS